MNKIYDFYSAYKGKVVAFLFLYAVSMTFAIYGHGLAGILLSVLIGVAKEAWDKVAGRGFSLSDLIVGWAGILMGILLSFLTLLEQEFSFAVCRYVTAAFLLSRRNS